MHHNNITKNQIILHVAEECNLNKNQAKKLVNDFFNVLTNYLINETTVKLSKFGSFKVKLKKQRYGRNPKDLKIAVIPERKVINFKSTKILNKIINQKLP